MAKVKVLSVFKTVLQCNIFRPKPLYYYNVIVCSLIISYCIVNTLNQIPLLNNIHKRANQKSLIETTTSSTSPKKTDIPMKYILLWTNPKKYPFVYFGEGASIFVNRSCEWTNCYVTGDRNFLGAHTEFEVIIFNGPQMSLLLYSEDYPMERHSHQKYVYANIESAANYPFRDNALNGFFNWTWTYKLNSDAYWGYVVIKDANNTVIGPQENMHWLDIAAMDPIGDDLKRKLRTKNTAAAWISSNCLTSSHREDYVNSLQKQLNRYNLTIDIYGDCGDHKCPKEIMPRCLKVIQRNYYFYLAFENSFSEDYVTEKILYALNHNTIPVVYGGANYSRFLPEGSYLDAVKLDPEKLAETMHEVISNRTAFYRFFLWKKYYSYHSTHESSATDVYCKFCAIINNETLMNDPTVYDKFNVWWMHRVSKII